MDRGSSSLLSRGATPRFTRYPRRVVKPSPCRRPFPAPPFLISRPTAPNFLFAASLAYWRNATPWVLPVLGGSPRRVGDIRGTGFVSAVWFRDGKEIVYAQGNSLYRAKADGTESRKIV